MRATSTPIRCLSILTTATTDWRPAHRAVSERLVSVDLNNNGAVGTGDLIVLLGSWRDPYGTADLIELLGNWGLCP